MSWWPFRSKTPKTGREPSPPIIGLALGGGAVRGAAHLGVLSVLEREGIRPAVIAGTSAGAIAGLGVAAGLSSAEMFAKLQRATWTKVGHPTLRNRRGLLDARPLAEQLEKGTGMNDFSELAIPFAAVASDLLTGERVVMTEGPLAQAVVASCSIPALFEPVERDGHTLVDGGLTDNVPIDVARDLGATYVIAVDVVPALEGALGATDWRDVLMLAYGIVQRGVGRPDVVADCLISPAVAGVPPWDFGAAPRAYEAGVAAAEEALPKLREDLGLDAGW